MKMTEMIQDLKMEFSKDIETLKTMQGSSGKKDRQKERKWGSYIRSIELKMVLRQMISVINVWSNEPIRKVLFNSVSHLA